MRPQALSPAEIRSATLAAVPAERRAATRLLIAVAIAGAATLLCWTFLTRQSQLEACDFNWALRAARDLVHGGDPYGHGFGFETVPYPLPAAFFGLPFFALPAPLAGALFFGISSGLLAYGLTRHGFAPLLVFLSYPYFAALFAVQWTPLLMAAALFPTLLPVVLAKPHIGLPIALTRFTWRGALLSLAVMAASFALIPDWPLRWLGQTGGYQHFFPVLVGLGPLLLIALCWRQDADAQFLLLMALTPQRWFYDALTLWLIPKQRREFVVTVFLSWGAGLLRMQRYPSSFAEAGSWAVAWFYLPMLAVLVVRHWKAARVPLARSGNADELPIAVVPAAAGK